MWLWRPRVRISSLTPLPFVGVSPSGKAPDFDFRTRRSESCHPCQRGALGCRQAVRHRTLTPAFRRFESYHPSQFYDPLAQPAEHLTFNQGVPRSNRGWITIVRGCGGMADAPALGAGTFGVGVQVPSSAPFHPIPLSCGSGSVVERCLAKANVASSNLVFRSIYGRLAQLVEQLTLNQWVQGSSP